MQKGYIKFLWSFFMSFSTMKSIVAGYRYYRIRQGIDTIELVQILLPLLFQISSQKGEFTLAPNCDIITTQRTFWQVCEYDFPVWSISEPPLHPKRLYLPTLISRPSRIYYNFHTIEGANAENESVENIVDISELSRKYERAEDTQLLPTSPPPALTHTPKPQHKRKV